MRYGALLDAGSGSSLFQAGSACAGRSSVVEHVDGQAGEDVLGEQEQRHVRPAPGAVDREEAQARHRQPEQVGVIVGHQLVGALGRGVERQRVAAELVRRERHPGVGAVDRAGRREHQVLHTVVAAALQHVQRAGYVAVDVGLRGLQRIAHAGLGGQVHDAIKLLAPEQIRHAGGVLKAELRNAEASLGREARQAGFLQCRVVVRVQVVESDDRITAAEQLVRDGRADEAGRTGDEYFHLR